MLLNVFRKVGALFLGLLIALLIIEFAIRIHGISAKVLQSYRNSNALSTHSSVRILCIGDSMTFGEYPLVLEELLNKKSRGISFKIIDGGRPGATSTDNLVWLERNIATYLPNVVIAMTGDHDNDLGRILLAPADLQGIRGWLKNLRLYRLWHYTRVLLLKHRLPLRATNANDLPPGNTTATTTEKQEKAPKNAELPQAQKQAVEQLSALIRDGKDREAQAFLLDYLRRYPKHAEARTWLGQLYARTRRRAEAEAQFERALKLEPQDYYALRGLAELWLEDNEKLPQAEELLQQATVLSPDDYQPFYQLGQACARQAKTDCAIENLRRAAELRPDFSPALLELASAYKDTDRYDASARTLETLLKTDPGNSMAYAQLCSLYSTYLPQKTAFMSAAKMALKNIRARNTIGLRVCAEQAARLLHELPLATRLHEQALKLAPDDTDTLTGAAAFYKREYNDTKKARTLSEKALRLNPQARDTTGLAFLLSEKEHAPVAQEQGFAPATIVNYRKIRQLLAERGITLVAMQYPTRRLQPLKDMLGENSGVYFVSNENMKGLAERHGYAKYFVDMYAGDFGHCTLEGNALVAENAAKVILEEVLKR